MADTSRRVDPAQQERTAVRRQYLMYLGALVALIVCVVLAVHFGSIAAQELAKPQNASRIDGS